MSRRLSVAVIAACPFPYPRGTPVRIHRSSEALAQAGIDVEVITYHLGNLMADPPFRVSRVRKIPTYRRRIPGPSVQKLLLMDPLLVGLVRRRLMEHDFDVIHAHHYEGLLVALASKPRQPILYDAHTTLESELSYYMPKVLGGTSRNLGKILDCWIPRQSNHVVAVTDKIKRRLVGWNDSLEESITVIPNGIDMEPFRNLTHQQRGNSETVVFAGNMASYQGVELLLHALKQILDVRPAARLLIVSNSTFAPYEQLAATLGIRDRIDVVDAEFEELPKYLARSDVAVSPRTECDGLPQKVLNYMAAGLPTVSFKGSAATLEDNVTGVLVDNGDIPSFAKSTSELLSNRDLARRIGQHAQATARLEYSWKAGADKMISLYEQVLTHNEVRRAT